MIASFGDQGTADLYHGRSTRRTRAFPSDIVTPALRKLDFSEAVHSLGDLHSPPGNRLELLRRTWRGFHSIRVNDQWRIVFRWSESSVHDVRLVDYHKG